MKTLRRVLYFWSMKMPHVLVWLSLTILIFSTLQKFYVGANFESILPFFFSAIALVIALASISFSYATAKREDKNEYPLLISAGEMFLYAGLILIMVFLISWLLFKTDHFIKPFSWYVYVKWPLAFIFALPFSLLTFAANAISKAIKILEENISFKIMHSIDRF